MILQESVADLNEVRTKMQLPQFRKSTLNMALGVSAIEKVLGGQNLNRDRLGLVLTTESGELETTIEFLKTLDQTKMARPLLFQTSLHNATAGFLSIHFGITGPVLTIASDDIQMQRGRDTAESLIRGEQCDQVLVLSVNVWSTLSNEFPKTKTIPEGARCLLIGKDS